MSDDTGYKPPQVWTQDEASGGRFSSINRPVAGPTHDKELPVGKHPLQLYSLATPNGVKVTVMLEELLAAGHTGAEYDAWLIRIGEGVNRIPDDVLLRFPGQPWRQIVAMRNFAAHQYDDLDPGRVWTTLTRDVPTLRSYLTETVIPGLR